MNEPFDVYADSFNISVGAWGAKLSFRLSGPGFQSSETDEPRPLGTVRMSNELLKTMVVLLREHVIAREDEHDVQFDVPNWVLAQIGMTEVEWDDFWGYSDED